MRGGVEGVALRKNPNPTDCKEGCALLTTLDHAGAADMELFPTMRLAPLGLSTQFGKGSGIIAEDGLACGAHLV